MKKTHNIIASVTLILLILFARHETAFCLVELENGWQVHDIESVDDNVYRRNGGDPYFIFPELDTPVCAISGVRLVLSLTPMISKPFLCEIFWRNEGEGFSEAKKVFFILHPGNKNPIDIIVPIRRDVGYRHIRFDLPRDINVDFSIDKHEVINIRSAGNDPRLVESFSKLSSAEAENPEILLPYLIHALVHGGKRLGGDPVFLIFWTGAIVLTLYGIRKTSILLRQDQRKQADLEKK